MIGPIFAPARRTAGSGQEKRETGATRLPLFEPGFRLGRKGRLRVVPGGRPEAGVPYSAASAIIESTDTYLRPSLPSWNRTRPSAVANRVWSLPIPTLTPGYALVPRRPPQIFPATPSCPPDFFHPKPR